MGKPKMIYLPNDIMERLKEVPNVSALIAKLLRDYLFPYDQEWIDAQERKTKEKENLLATQ